MIASFRLRPRRTCRENTSLRKDSNNSGPPAHASRLGLTRGATAALTRIVRALTKQAPRAHRAADPVRDLFHFRQLPLTLLTTNSGPAKPREQPVATSSHTSRTNPLFDPSHPPETLLGHQGNACAGVCQARRQVASTRGTRPREDRCE